MTVTIKPVHLAIALLTCGLLILSVFGVVRHYRSQASDAQREAEAVELKAHGDIVAAQKTSAEVAEEAARLADSNTVLRAEIERIKAQSPGAAPVQTIVGVTAPATSSAPPKASGCLVDTTDKLRLKVDIIELRTKKDNYVLAGVARALRINAAGAETELVASPFESTSQLAVVSDDEKRLGWGVGPLGILSTHGTAYGLQVSPPPLKVFGLDLALTAGVAIGTAGAVAMGGLLIRL